MVSLEMVECYASIWHAGTWRVDSLPADLGLVSVVFPAAGSVLGVSLLKARGIAIADRLEGHALKRPVMLHECGHHILGLSSSAALCQTDWRPDLPAKDEALAWAAAGRMSVSAAQVVDLDRRRVSLAELADDNGVPPALIALGVAVYHANRGDRGALVPALTAWCDDMQRLVHLL